MELPFWGERLAVGDLALTPGELVEEISSPVSLVILKWVAANHPAPAAINSASAATSHARRLQNSTRTPIHLAVALIRPRWLVPQNAREGRTAHARIANLRSQSLG